MKHFINLKDIPANDLRKIITDAKKELSNAELTSENNSCSGSKSKSCS